MKLFVDSNYLSPYALSAFVALREKSLPFTVVPVDLQGAEHLQSAYGQVSATRRIPTLSDDGFHLSESSAICEYLEEVYPGAAIYPAAPRSRAKAREIQAWLRSDLMPIREERGTDVVFLRHSPPPLTSAGQAAAAKLFAAAEQWLSADSLALFGQWSIADTDLALMLNRLVLAGDAVPERLARFARTQWQRPSVQAWVGMPRSGQ
ncbi:glutathione S-transferase [Stutzerimonas stutzeri TS44]|nr:glutathione S-transferase [Stutzerimonas stutzeri TS44]